MMMNTIQRTGGRLLAVLAIVALAGCGDVDTAAENQASNDQAQGQNQDSNQQQNDGQQQNDQKDDEDCDDGEIFNPVLEECVEDPDANDQNDDPNQTEEDCEVDEEWDEDAEECVDKCPVNQVWDEEDEECVQVGECADNEEWNEETQECERIDECGPGNISGQTCRPDGGILPGATVKVEGVDCEGYEYTDETTADENGYYDLYDVPSGEHELTIQSGSWEQTDPVVVQKGETTDLSSEAAKICVEGEDVNIAVIEGGWDDIGAILDGIDVDYTTYSSNSDAEDLVSDLDALREYDIVFAECSASLGGWGWDTDQEILEANVRRIVTEGNSLYASDLADDYIEDPLPDAVEFSDSHSGSGNQDVTADVLTQQFQDVLGSSTMDIHFDAGGWSIAYDGGPSSEVHIRADVDTGSTTLEDAALLTTYDDPIGNGRAVFTSFHNIAQPTGDMEEILEHVIFTL